MRRYQKVQVLKLLNQHLGVYPTPMNLNWNWSWGSLSGLLLASQIVTGILLAMHYGGHVDHAFASVQHLMVDVPSGVIIRYAHANGASLFFTVVYLHVLRGLYYSSGTQPREILWISGVIILLLMIITAFIGYCYSQKWIFNVLIEDYTFFLIRGSENQLTNWLAGWCQWWVHTGDHPKDYLLNYTGLREQLGKGVYKGERGTPLFPIPHLSQLLWGATPHNQYTIGYGELCPSCSFECIGLVNPKGIDLNGSPIQCLGTGLGTPFDLLLYSQIIVNSKDGIKLSITPVKSYDNVHLKDIQFNILRDNKQKSAIYLIYNKINGNSYIGSASSNRINVRFRNHCIHYTGGNKPLTRAIHKYGLDNFSFHILEYFNGFVKKENFNKNHIQLLELETSYFSKYKPIYNILTTAGSSIALKHTEETKHKMRSNYSDERRELIGNLNKGKGLSDSTKKLMSETINERFKDANYKAQFLLKIKHTLLPKKKVFLYDPKGVLISEYESVNMVSQVFSRNRKTIRKYLDNPTKMFKKIGYLKTKEI